MKKYIASEGDTLDYITWKVYGRQDAGTVERVIQANHGLADIGPALPAGTAVNIPIIEKSTTERGTRLWD